MKKMIMLMAMAVLLALVGCTSRNAEKQDSSVSAGNNDDTLTYPVGVNATIYVNYSEDPLLYDSPLNCSNNRNGTLPVYRIDSVGQLQDFID